MCSKDRPQAFVFFTCQAIFISQSERGIPVGLFLMLPLHFIGKIHILYFSEFSRPDLTVRYHEDWFNQESALKEIYGF